MNCINIIFLMIFLLAGIDQFGRTSPVHSDGTEISATSSLPPGEPSMTTAEPNEPQAPSTQKSEAAKQMASIKAPTDYDVQQVAEKAAFKVYGGLPIDKQPKKLKDIQEAAKKVSPPPPADYDVERVAAKAADWVYGWLPIEQQPKLMSEEERASYVQQIYDI